MSAFFLLFSHTLTDEQSANARETLGVTEFIALPPELQALWSDVPPDAEYLADHLQPLLHWLSQEARPGDVVLIQGDFGAVYLTAKWVLQRRLIPVYATTRREVVEIALPDGSIQKQSRFRHVRFRRYEP
ncbi:uncharacterized protein MJ1673 [Candidatus Moduliflexus flocculans]|uniref:Uncharacterized protein MJ1673 n=1 Tax=Candidatus Moduliflexus flocculans TaxID=1499966 RepID=A0A081BLD7_9BACT|nr:uncharacterized protein MJ1673 [Candidatus Moduliflexus flocculans]